MKGRRSMNIVAALLLIAAFTGSVLALTAVDSARGKQATLEEVLYIPSGKTLKKLSLGYSGLLADIYWTRAVQYFGGKLREDSQHYELLYPLLDITTDLDPHLLVAYQFGSVFLSQSPPSGAGQPDKAVALVEKGIRNNPDYWRLYFTLGFIHYMDRKDYKSAEQAFQKGSENPKSLVWMKVMAATMAQHAAEPGTAVEIWKRLYETSDDKMIRDNAAQHLTALRVDQNVQDLEQRVHTYFQKTGRLPSSWYDLVRAGLLGGIPLDPVDAPYKLTADGKVEVADPDKLPFITEGIPPGWTKSPKHP
jgi:tetratricopeptide (TPR) repeat protein